MCGFLHGRMPQRIPSLEFKSFINSCYLPRFTTTEKQNHKSLMKNAAYAGIPWRMCSTFYLAVVHKHRLSTNRDITMLSRSYQARHVTEVTEVGQDTKVSQDTQVGQDTQVIQDTQVGTEASQVPK